MTYWLRPFGHIRWRPPYKVDTNILGIVSARKHHGNKGPFIKVHIPSPEALDIGFWKMGIGQQYQVLPQTSSYTQRTSRCIQVYVGSIFTALATRHVTAHWDGSRIITISRVSIGYQRDGSPHDSLSCTHACMHAYGTGGNADVPLKQEI